MVACLLSFKEFTTPKIPLPISPYKGAKWSLYSFTWLKTTSTYQGENISQDPIN
jgi:hypothetical protein